MTETTAFDRERDCVTPQAIAAIVDAVAACSRLTVELVDQYGPGSGAGQEHFVRAAQSDVLATEALRQMTAALYLASNAGHSTLDALPPTNYGPSGPWRPYVDDDEMMESFYDEVAYALGKVVAVAGGMRMAVLDAYEFYDTTSSFRADLESIVRCLDAASWLLGEATKLWGSDRPRGPEG